MSRAWIRAKQLEFARDLLRDFCLAARDLTLVFDAFQDGGGIDYDALRLLTGSVMDKGILWRLKDTAHHLLREGAHDGEPFHLGSFLDWALGYIYHEVVKIREDAHQHQHYAPWFHSLERETLSEEEVEHCRALVGVLGQTEESLRREISRVRHILSRCVLLFPPVLHGYRESPLLARFLFSQEDLVRQVFQDQHETLLEVVYGDDPQMLYLLAAQSLREGGWVAPAKKALDEARRLRPECPLVLNEASRLDRLCARRPFARRGVTA